MKRYYTDAEYRDYVTSKAHNRRVRKLGLAEITRPKRLIQYLLNRDERTCGICRKFIEEDRGLDGPSIGHIIPLSRGGLHELPNVRLEHLRCNLRKGAKLDEELE